MYIRDWFIRWLFEYGDRKKYKGLPRGCWNCEVLGLCRRPKEEGWKCYDGCMLINAELAYKYEGLPKGCWRCRYLTECRRPKEEGWKCYNGCRVILLYVEGMSQKEVAKTLGISVQRVSKIKQDALFALKEMLED